MFSAELDFNKILAVSRCTWHGERGETAQPEGEVEGQRNKEREEDQEALLLAAASH